MQQLLRRITFWSFQVINTLTAFLMTFFPKAFHESLFDKPEEVYATLGFSDLAVEMVHNIIRGQGTALLAVSLFIWVVGQKSRPVYLLIFFVCILSLYAHAMTFRQHMDSDLIVSVIGDFGSLYMTMLINTVVGIFSAVVYFRWEEKKS